MTTNLVGVIEDSAEFLYCGRLVSDVTGHLHCSRLSQACGNAGYN